MQANGPAARRIVKGFVIQGFAAAVVWGAVAASVAASAVAETIAPIETPVAGEAANISAMHLEGAELDLKYDFYIGGLPVAEGRMTGAVGVDAYRIASELTTSRLVSMFFGAELDARVEGVRRADGGLFPADLEASFTTKKDDQTMRVRYGENAPMSVEAEPPFRKKKYEVDPTEMTDALDPMTAIATVLTPRSIETMCERLVPVFDGRKRYDLAFIGVRRDNTRRGKRVIECNGEYRRVAGFKKKHLERGAYPFFIRFQLTKDGTPEATKIWTETDFGHAVAVRRR